MLGDAHSATASGSSSDKEITTQPRQLFTENAADDRARGDQAGGRPGDMGRDHEDDARDEVDEPRRDDLDRVDPLELLVEGEPEDGEHEDPLGRAEVAAVHAAQPDGHSRHGAGALPRAVPTLAEDGGEPWLQDDHDEREADEDRHDGIDDSEREGGLAR